MNFDESINWLKSLFEEGKSDFLGAVFFGLLILILTYFVRKPFFSLLKLLNLYHEKKIVIPKSLRTYKAELEKETLQLNHSWKPETQTLKELIVPVNVTKKGQVERLPLTRYISETFQQNPTSRFVIIGNAGSGKSVAIGIIAREIWRIKLSKPLVPVLLTFSDIKDVKTEKEFQNVIAKTFERLQFEKGKRNNKAEKFVSQNLYKGQLFLLLDGLDELEKSNRITITAFLNHFFQTYPNIPFIISSRASVWNQTPNIFPLLSFELIQMAEFTPYEIRLFLSQWEFTGKKSAEQLADLINNKAYLKSIAVNPLMLTIISFLYAQPKRILPDNRVKFYEECVDALMEKWDNTRNLDRANKFETIDKKTILSKLAYEHITNAQRTDEDISKKIVLDVITKTMESLSRPIENREKMLIEIVQNAELLIYLPPDSYKFPHRTFMEYFAANYFFEKDAHSELLSLYTQDPGKWEETLSLFCGLNTNSEISDNILITLQKLFTTSSETNQTNTFVFRALLESARINPQLAEDILNFGRKTLEQEIYSDVLENIGFIAMNPNWQHSKLARSILKDLLSKSNLTDIEFQTIAIALTNIKDEEIQNTLIQQAERLDFAKVLEKIGQTSEAYVYKLLDNIPAARYSEIFQGLATAGRIELLFNIMCNASKTEIQEAAAWSLCLLSKPDSFLELLDNIDLEKIPNDLKKVADEKLSFWKWKKSIPKTTQGQKAALLICEYTARFFINKKFDLNLYDKQSEIHSYIRFLISAFLVEKNYLFRKTNLMNINKNIWITKYSLRNHWDKGDNVNYSVLLILVSIFSIIWNFPGWVHFLLWEILYIVLGVGVNTLGVFIEKHILKSKHLKNGINNFDGGFRLCFATTFLILLVIIYYYYQLNFLTLILFLTLFLGWALFTIATIVSNHFFYYINTFISIIPLSEKEKEEKEKRRKKMEEKSF